MIIGFVRKFKTDAKGNYTYRLLDLDSKLTTDVKGYSILGEKLPVQPLNLKLQNGNVDVTYGEIDTYPVLNGDGSSSSYIVLYKAKDDTYVITDIHGKMNNYSFSQLQGMDIGNPLFFARLRERNNDELISKSKEIAGKLGYKTESTKINELIAKSKGFKLREKIEDNSGNYKLDIEKTDDGRVVVKGISPITYTGTVDIPNGVTTIADGAFRYCKASGYNIPETVVYLGEYAFAETEVLELKLPKSITAISHYCFWKSLIESINLENISSIGNFAFVETSLREIELSDSLVQVGVSAFEKCLMLTSVKHGPNLKKIRQGAFRECKELSEFDLSTIEDLEAWAFYDTSLSNVVINSNVGYVKAGTILSDKLETVEFQDGVYKVADYAIINNQFPITYTIPKSVVNLGVKVIKETDTVRIYHKSTADSIAKVVGCNVEYIDDNDSVIPKSIMKANLLRLDIKDLFIKLIKDSYSKDDVEYDYELDESKFLNAELDADTLKMLGIDSVEVPNDYKEKGKFRVLLDHYSRACKMDGVGFCNTILSIKDTFSVENKIIYDDGISRVYEFSYIDNRYQSKWAKYIVAMTGNNVRFCCIGNRLTDIYCNTPYSKDLKSLLAAIVPGDTIGYNCSISGQRYDEIAAKIDLKDKNNKPIQLSMNIFQALYNCSITVKLERNRLAIILPVNGKILDCSNLGKSVWQNENDESYKSKNCLINDIQDYANNTIIDYGVNSPNRNDLFFKEFRNLSTPAISQRLKDYSVIGNSIMSPYMEFRNYCIDNDVKELGDLDLMGIGNLMGLPIIERRIPEWLDSASEKTIVKDEHPEFTFADGSVVYQYKTVKRVALKNKLMVGGDSTVYIFDIYNFIGDRIGVFASIISIDRLFSDAISINNMVGKPVVKVYRDKTKLDVVDTGSIIPIAPASSVIAADRTRHITPIWLVVYKPNGLYYLAYYEVKKRETVLLVQVGNLNVVLDYFANVDKSVGDRFGTLQRIAEHELYKRRHRALGYSTVRPLPEYESFLKARSLVIDGIKDYNQYRPIQINSAIKYMFGVNTDDSIYELKEKSKYSSGEEIDFGEAEFGNEVSDDEQDNMNLDNIDMSEFDEYGDDEPLSELEDAERIRRLIEGN